MISFGDHCISHLVVALSQQVSLLQPLVNVKREALHVERVPELDNRPQNEVNNEHLLYIEQSLARRYTEPTTQYLHKHTNKSTMILLH